MLTITLLTASIIVDAVGQVRVEGMRDSFTGDKTRFVIDFSGRPGYSVEQDWLNNRIVVSMNGVEYSERHKSKIEDCRNYIVNNVKVDDNGFNPRILINTSGEFKVKYGFLSEGSRLYVDVFRNFDKIDLKTMLERATVYENRKDFTHAAAQLEQALTLNPTSDAIKYSIGSNLLKSGEPLKAVSRLKEIRSDSQYFTAAQDLIKPYTTVNTTKKDMLAEKQPVEQNDNGKIDSEIYLQEHSEPSADKESRINNGNEENGTTAVKEKQLSQVEEKKKTVQAPRSVPTDEQKNESIKSTGISNVLKKSGVANYILAGLYVVLAMLITTVVYVGKKIFSLNRPGRKKTKAKARKTGRSKKTLPVSAKSRKTVRDPLVDKTRMAEIQTFAKKLTKAYAKTDSAVKKKAVVPIPAKSKMKEYGEEHNVRIENVFEREDNLLNVDSEAVSLIKKFKDGNSPSSGDKYEAIKQLATQGWEVWEIARELGVGSEEIKIALEMGDSQQGVFGEEELYAKIYSLADLKLTASAIAERLRIGEEEVKLALKMRKTEDEVIS